MTVYMASSDGLVVPSDIQAACDICGVEGLKGDWPGQGGIVPDESGRPICDDCAEVTNEDVLELLYEAGKAGDVQRLELCWGALHSETIQGVWLGSNGQAEAWDDCVRAIRDAQG